MRDGEKECNLEQLTSQNALKDSCEGILRNNAENVPTLTLEWLFA